MDPQLFVGINDYARELLKGEHSGKYTPIESAQWIEDYAEAANQNLTKAKTAADKQSKPEFRRMAIDVAMQVELGRFFGTKFRCGVLYGIFEQSGERRALEESVKMYQKARSCWAKLADLAKDVYKSDVTVGEIPNLRGHWLDRLPSMDKDIAFMAQKLEQTKAGVVTNQHLVDLAIAETLGRPKRTGVVVHHNKADKFKAGQPVNLLLSFEKMPKSVEVYYRHVTQAERYEKIEMKAEGNTFKATISGDYTNSKYPLEYYFVLRNSPESAWLYPGFNENHNNQPYFVIRQA
jgi:hypothetical protein